MPKLEINYLLFTFYDQLTRPTHINGRFLFLGVKIWFIWEDLQKKMINLSQFTDLIVHLVEKMFLFNREVRYYIHSGSGLVGSGSKMIYSGSLSGSGKKFRILIWIRQKVPYPTGSGSTTLLKS
jgi:hypothetical protein